MKAKKINRAYLNGRGNLKEKMEIVVSCIRSLRIIENLGKEIRSQQVVPAHILEIRTEDF